MKRNTARLFSLLLIFLIFFTIVSPRVEEEMRTEVDAKIRKGTGRQNVSISNMAIIWPESEDVLFTITEGTGWESGLRITEVSSTYFDRGINHITLGPGREYWYIYSASREPVAGHAVTTVETKTAADTYILWHPEHIQSLILPAGAMEVLSKSNNAALVYHKKATAPFFEHNLWYILKDTAGEEIRIFSLRDTEQMIKALPWVAGVFAVLVCCLILWGGIWRNSRSKAVVAINTIFMVGLFAVLPWLLGQFDLPASLLPKQFILDIPHYAGEFRKITEAMDTLGDPSVGGWLSGAGLASAAILGVSVLTASALVTAENIICRRKEKKK